MILQDLTIGQEVTLEIRWGESVHELKTEVVGSNDSGLLIKPFIYNGVIINLPAHKAKDIIFNIYAIDPVTSTRMSWKNAIVQPVVYKDRTYYACRVNDFSRNATSSERRDHMRMALDLQGTITGQGLGNVPITIKDMSDNGISFLMDSGYAVPSGNLTIRFNDIVRGNPFSIKVKCRIVRDQANSVDCLYGCKIIEAPNDVLIYVCLKRMDFNSRY